MGRPLSLVGATAALSIMAMALGAGTASAATTPMGTITQFTAGITAGSGPTITTTGPDGAVWFTERGGDGIGRITMDGQVTEFRAGITGGAAPNDITSGPDGNLWFTGYQGQLIGRITPQGVVTEFPLPGGVRPFKIVTGSDANLWFTSPDTNALGRITPQGSVTMFPTGSAGGEEVDIARGPDGNLWFTERLGNAIGRMTTSGSVARFTAGISAFSAPLGIAAGPDGAMWFTQSNGNRVARITMDGAVTEFSAGISAGSAPWGIAPGPDGAMWFTERTGNRVARITTSGMVTEFSAGISPGGLLAGINPGPDGNMWFAAETANAIGRITSGAVRRLTVTRAGTGSGNVRSSSGLIDCGPTCAADPDYLATVTLTATARSGSRFAGWGGACTGTATCTLAMTEARDVRATFTADTPAVTPTTPVKKLAGKFRLNRKTRVGTTTGRVPAGVTRIVQGARAPKTRTTRAKRATGKCRITKRNYRCTIRMTKGTWTVTTTARGKAGVVAKGVRKVRVR